MHTLLVATTDAAAREFLAAQLDADGHTVHEADSSAAVTAKLTAHGVDVLILGALQRPADATLLVRSLRAGRLHTRVHPAQPVITLGPTDEFSILRAYEAGSDHHLASDSGYLVLRAVIAVVAWRALHDVVSRHVHVGALHIDTAARTADVNGTPVKLSRIEYEVLAKLASDPSKLFTKAELKRTIWGQTPPRTDRTIDSHVCHLRQRLRDAGAQLVHNRRGTGYILDA
jgi:two-component system KDP operon response regulator KdpE